MFDLDDITGADLGPLLDTGIGQRAVARMKQVFVDADFDAAARDTVRIATGELDLDPVDAVRFSLAGLGRAIPLAGVNYAGLIAIRQALLKALAHRAWVYQRQTHRTLDNRARWWAARELIDRAHTEASRQRGEAA